ncbi:hypothetical protein LXL04_009447 [Taraxacum kok-saghyz]
MVSVVKHSLILKKKPFIYVINVDKNSQSSNVRLISQITSIDSSANIQSQLEKLTSIAARHLHDLQFHLQCHPHENFTTTRSCISQIVVLILIISSTNPKSQVTILLISSTNPHYFNNGIDYSQILKSLISTGFQASNLGDAIETFNQMLDWRLSHEQVTEDCSEEESKPEYRESVKCKILLGFTSNLISSGVRDIIRYLTQHHMVDVIVTTTGGIEEDLIKCLADTYRGEFSLPGASLRSKGLNRIVFTLCAQQDVLWTPSKVISRLGKEINNESSYLYWAYKVITFLTPI